jgi:hypothetical protein
MVHANFPSIAANSRSALTPSTNAKSEPLPFAFSNCGGYLKMPTHKAPGQVFFM